MMFAGFSIKLETMKKFHQNIFSDLHSKMLHKTHKKMEKFILKQCFTLYHFGEAISQNEVCFNRQKFNRVSEYLEKYCLFNYRSLCQKPPPPSTLTNLSVTKWTAHNIILAAFYTIFTLKCTLVLTVPRFTSTFERRALLGTEMFKDAGLFIETIFGLWASICFCFLYFNLTPNLLDYKFLAVIMLTKVKHSWLWFRRFGLTKTAFFQFDNFRRAILCNYLLQISMIPFFNFFGILFILVRTKLLFTNPLTSLFWWATIQFDAVHGPASKLKNFVLKLYKENIFKFSAFFGNLSLYIIVTRYIHLKQTVINRSIVRCLKQLSKPNKRKDKAKARFHQLWTFFLLRQVEKLCHLQEELQDYNRFWGLFLSSVFFNCSALISYLVYLVCFTRVFPLMKFTIFLALLCHIVVFALLTHYSSVMVLTAKKMATKLKNHIARQNYGFSASSSSSSTEMLAIVQQIKVKF